VLAYLGKLGQNLPQFPVFIFLKGWEIGFAGVGDCLKISVFRIFLDCTHTFQNEHSAFEERRSLGNFGAVILEAFEQLKAAGSTERLLKYQLRKKGEGGKQTLMR
jgi:hypothetical protein